MGAGSTAFNANNLTSFNDGTITLTATSTDQAGNTSAQTTQTFTKDVIAPANPTSVTLTNGLGQGIATRSQRSPTPRGALGRFRSLSRACWHAYLVCMRLQVRMNKRGLGFLQVVLAPVMPLHRCRCRQQPPVACPGS